jgi:hypothetical protein
MLLLLLPPLLLLVLALLQCRKLPVMRLAGPSSSVRQGWICTQAICSSIVVGNG